jgi:hypothetical protein
MVYPIKKKLEILDKFKQFVNYLQTAENIKIRTLRSNNGGKYKNKLVRNYCEANEVIQEFTIPHNPEQNGMWESNRLPLAIKLSTGPPHYPNDQNTGCVFRCLMGIRFRY